MPEHEGVDVAEDRIAAIGCRPCAINIIENPLDLRAAEVGG